jgi:tRNA (guanine37-N1)-methyltransferase
VLRSKRQKNVVATEQDGEKMLLFGPEVGTTFEELVDRLKNEDKKRALELLEKTKIRCQNHSYVRGYDELTGAEALRMALPSSVKEVPKSFEISGHICHLNLNDELLPYKELIGQVILDKHPNLRTVVNKTGNIETQFRTFPLEVIAGVDDLDVEVVEHGNRFRFNFAKVYWNSRLGQEHQRLTERFYPGDIVVDAFCGVGPFAIPAAKKGCIVHANDLNPESFSCLLENVRINHVAEHVSCSNECAREFIKRKIAKDRVLADHFVMNLPDSAITFLDSFKGIFSRDLYEGAKGVTREGKEPRTKRPKVNRLPFIHCYCFKKMDETESTMIQRAESYLGGKLNPETVEFRRVRNVAPAKDMYCLHFQLPAEIAFATESNIAEAC